MNESSFKLTSNLCQEIVLPTGRNRYEEEVWKLEIHIHTIRNRMYVQSTSTEYREYRELIRDADLKIKKIKEDYPEYFL